MSTPVAPPHLVGRAPDGTFAVHKPSGMPVHAGAPGGPPDLASLLARGLPGLPPGLVPVHRLDIGASGIVLCTADPAQRARLGDALAAGAIEKAYLCLVFGRTRPRGTITRPLPDPRRGAPLAASTRYATLEVLGGFSLLAVRIDTGRKHQIRRHLAGIGHPLVGDTRHGPARARVPAFPGRLWLHARTVALPGGPVFQDPLPAALLAHLAALRDGLAAGEE